LAARSGLYFQNSKVKESEMDSTMTTLLFQETTFNPVKRDSQTWLRMSEIEQALGYAMKGRALAQIYTSHADEFTATMTRVMRLATAGGKQAIRVFSLRGAHLLAMFARTDAAKAFRIWVLNILDREVAKPAAQQVKSYNFPISMTKPHDHDPALNNDTLSPRVLLDPRNRAPEVELLDQLARDGHDVSGARLRITALRKVAARFMRTQARMADWSRRMGELIDEQDCYSREEGIGVLYARPLDPRSGDAMVYPEQLAAMQVPA
jgi:prophage antirepressor-like protein